MNKTPLVSLLIPVYNVQNYLEQCLRSATNQTLENIQIICINDGSTDSSAKILEHFAERDRRIQLIDKVNSGYGASLNLGLAAATGDFIAFLESDDWMEADTLASLLTHATQNDANLVRANYWRYWSLPKEKNLLERANPEKFANQTIDPLKHTNVFQITPSIWAGIYRRSMLEEAGIKFLETPGASYQDTSFAFKCWAAAKRAVLLKAAFVHYRQDNEASSVHSLGKAYCVIDEIHECQRFLEKDKPELLDSLQPVLAKKKLLTYLWNLDRLGPDLRAQFATRATRELTLDLQVGRFTKSDLKPWHKAELQALTKDTQWFLTIRGTRDSNLASRARYYFELGGVALMFKAAMGMLSGNNLS